MLPLRGVLVLALVIAMAGSLGSASAGDVPEFHAYLTPELNVVEIDSLVEISFEVDSTAMQFNAYEITIQFDPDVVSFDSVQQGPLMVNACGNRFTDLSQTDLTVTYVHSLLCTGVSLDGPGVLSVFRFTAHSPGTSPIALVSDPDRSFFDDGLFIWASHPTFPRQVVFHDASIVVFDPMVSVSDPGRIADGGLATRVTPNPFSSEGTIEFILEESSSGVGVEIFDLRGRRVRTWHLGATGAGTVRRQWDGTDSSGRSVAPGTYFYRVEAGGLLGRGAIRVLR